MQLFVFKVDKLYNHNNTKRNHGHVTYNILITSKPNWYTQRNITLGVRNTSITKTFSTASFDFHTSQTKKVEAEMSIKLVTFTYVLICTDLCNCYPFEVTLGRCNYNRKKNYLTDHTSCSKAVISDLSHYHQEVIRLTKNMHKCCKKPHSFLFFRSH